MSLLHPTAPLARIHQVLFSPCSFVPIGASRVSFAPTCLVEEKGIWRILSNQQAIYSPLEDTRSSLHTFPCHAHTHYITLVFGSSQTILTEHHAVKGYWRSEGITPCILNLGARWRWLISFTTRPFYPQRKSPWYQLTWRMGGAQSQSGRGGEEKNPHLLPGLEPPIIQPVAQRYTSEVFRLLFANYRRNTSSQGSTSIALKKQVTAQEKFKYLSCNVY
jgi:hypothetical protein